MTERTYDAAGLAAAQEALKNDLTFTEDELRFVDVPLVYVAGPYTTPDPVENTHIAIRAAQELADTGDVACFVPHLTLLAHLVVPRPVDYWYAYDYAFVCRSDAVYRLGGRSSGADKEVALAAQRGIPVFYDVDALLAWSRHEWGE